MDFFKECYDTINIKTDKRNVTVKIEELPDFVVEYLIEFYKNGWSIEFDELWDKTLIYLESLVPNETIMRITGDTYFTDIIYEYEDEG